MLLLEACQNVLFAARNLETRGDVEWFSVRLFRIKTHELRPELKYFPVA